METAMLADIRIGAENAEFGALERRWNIVAGDGLSVRLPLIVGHAKALELLITGRTYEERLRIEAELAFSMFMRRDSHALGARAFKDGREPEWPNHGL